MRILALLALATALAALDTGAPAPAFTLPSSAGAPVALSAHAGKIVVLEWINHDCPFVKKHYDSGNMQALQREVVAAGGVWLSICSSAPGKQGHRTPEQWQAITAEKNAAPTAVLIDADGAVGKAYGAKTTPQMFVIAANGTVAYQGAIDSDSSTDPKQIAGATNHVRAALADLAAGRPVANGTTKPYGCSVKY